MSSEGVSVISAHRRRSKRQQPVDSNNGHEEGGHRISWGASSLGSPKVVRQSSIKNVLQHFTEDKKKKKKKKTYSSRKEMRRSKENKENIDRGEKNKDSRRRRTRSGSTSSTSSTGNSSSSSSEDSDSEDRDSEDSVIARKRQLWKKSQKKRERTRENSARERTAELQGEVAEAVLSHALQESLPGKPQSAGVRGQTADLSVVAMSLNRRARDKKHRASMFSPLASKHNTFHQPSSASLPTRSASSSSLQTQHQQQHQPRQPQHRSFNLMAVIEAVRAQRQKSTQEIKPLHPPPQTAEKTTPPSQRSSHINSHSQQQISSDSASSDDDSQKKKKKKKKKSKKKSKKQVGEEKVEDKKASSDSDANIEEKESEIETPQSSPEKRHRDTDSILKQSQKKPGLFKRLFSPKARQEHKRLKQQDEVEMVQKIEKDDAGSSESGSSEADGSDEAEGKRKKKSKKAKKKRGKGKKAEEGEEEKTEEDEEDEEDEEGNDGKKKKTGKKKKSPEEIEAEKAAKIEQKILDKEARKKARPSAGRTGLLGLIARSNVASGLLALAAPNLLDKADAVSQMYDGIVLPHRMKVNEEKVASFVATLPKHAVLSLTIQHMHLILPAEHVMHPVIKVSLVDVTSGQFWPKPNKHVPAVAALETQLVDEAGDLSPLHFVLPMMTKPVDLRRTGKYFANWNEELVVNVPVEAFLKPELLMLFELIDFGPNVDPGSQSAGCAKLAWGFFKLINTKGGVNSGSFELQLFRIPLDRPKPPKKNLVPPVYYDFVLQAHTKRRLYPSSLHIKVGGVEPPPVCIVRGMRTQFATDEEVGRIEWTKLKPALSIEDMIEGGGGAGGFGRDRVRSATMTACDVPNQRVQNLRCGAGGCFAMAHSPGGALLAAACSEALVFTIKIFSSIHGKLLYIFTGHTDIVYDLSWSHDGKYLVSASSDCTCRVWEVAGVESEMGRRSLSPNPAKNLQHTSFVYCCRFVPGVGKLHLVATATYDGVIRIWDVKTGGVHQTLKGHRCRVNSLAFHPSGIKFFSADGEGVIKVWSRNMSKSEARSKARPIKASSRGSEGFTAVDSDSDDEEKAEPHKFMYSCFKSIDNELVAGKNIHCIAYHHRPEKLVAYTSDSVIYLFSLLRYEVRRQLVGAVSGGSVVRCLISPDSQFVLAGSVDGKAYFWDLTTGVLEKCLDLGFPVPLNCVSWHPRENRVAFGAYGGDYPIQIWEFCRQKHSEHVAAIAKQAKKKKNRRKKTETDRDADGIRIGRWEKDKFHEAIRESLDTRKAH